MKFREQIKAMWEADENRAYHRAFAVAYISAFALLMMMIGAIELSHFLRQF
jgi:uncharacterized BrkB/YihY/UPF0761 family membrane protein